jgi:poly-gamma-glutamate synthesis protein (capsule biosynthesis protein)
MPTLLLTGDVMLGRGIDQILGSPNSPEIYEPFCKSALDYVALAERRNGPIPRGVGSDYIWGDALEDLRGADLAIINLEAAITCCDVPAPKGINYRCHPANLDCLTAAGIDCCVLANNHVLDWGEDGLIETLRALDSAELRRAGAGFDIADASAPAVLALPGGGRLLVYALGSPSSGIPPFWAAGPGKPGVHLLADNDQALEHLRGRTNAEKRPGDLAVVSIHWGPNWGYDIEREHQRFTRALIDQAQIDIVHGHSSHHPKAIELWRGRPILYGCGDFLNDYEGISGHESYLPDLVLAYLITLEPDGLCASLELLPFRIARFQLTRASAEEAQWLASTMDRVCRRFGGEVNPDGGTLQFVIPAGVH